MSKVINLRKGLDLNLEGTAENIVSNIEGKITDVAICPDDFTGCVPRVVVKEGDNELEIEVVNTWVNRLIGDQKLPEAQRTTWTPCSPWTADSPLQKAGLMGPVVIESVTYEK